MKLAAALALLTLAGNPAETRLIGDKALAAHAASRFDKRAKMGTHEVLGLNRGVAVVVDYPCSDLCPDYTMRIIHYDLPPGPACRAVGGIKVNLQVPRGVGRSDEAFCMPRAVAMQLRRFPEKVLG